MNRSSSPEPRRFFSFRPHFTIAGLLALMLVATVVASGGSYLWSAVHGRRVGLMVFFPFVLIVPFALMIGAYWLLRALSVSSSEDDDETHFLG